MEKMEKKKRPDEITGTTIKIRTKCHPIYVTINELDGRPFEIFVSGAKSGTCMQVQNATLAIVISLYLRYGCPVEELILRLKGIQCGQKNGMRSCADAIGTALELVHSRLKDGGVNA